MSELQEISAYIEEYVRDDEQQKTMLAMVENGDAEAWRRLVIRRKLIIDLRESELVQKGEMK